MTIGKEGKLIGKLGKRTPIIDLILGLQDKRTETKVKGLQSISQAAIAKDVKPVIFERHKTQFERFVFVLIFSSFQKRTRVA